MFGRVSVHFDAAGKMTYNYRLRGVEPNVVGGTHIHTGTSCYDATMVGGHYWNAGVDGTNPDPWTTANGAVYRSNAAGSATGSFTIDSDYGFAENQGHAVVVHAADGSRIGCGVIQRAATGGTCMVTTKLQGCVSPYPGSNSTVTGKILVSIETATKELTYNYFLKNLESSVKGGTHIHSGTTCDDAALVGGHYWDAGTNGTNPDPWTTANGAVYSTNEDGIASGNFLVTSEYGYAENKDHAVVVHAADGSRVGCGVLGHKYVTCD